MYLVDIEAVISPDKMIEFTQSKMTFINALYDCKGYQGFTEVKDDNFRIQISLDSKDALISFMESDTYHFFNGALKTISSSHSIKFFENNNKQSINN